MLEPVAGTGRDHHDIALFQIAGLAALDVVGIVAGTVIGAPFPRRPSIVPSCGQLRLTVDVTVAADLVSCPIARPPRKVRVFAQA